MANDPQDPFYSTQDIVSIDVESFYNKAIKDIDAFRSRFSATTSNIAQSISLNDLDSIFSNNEVNSTDAQESRCNAFYRMIGLPVLAGDGASLYSPGFDPDVNRDATKLQKRLDIANSCIKKFRSILDQRELYAKNSINLFANQDNTASATLIASMYPRPFERQFKDGLNPTDIDQQVLIVPDRKNVISDFDDTTTFSTVSTHILKPFIVDPRIELTVTPATNRICVPFLSDKSQTQLSKYNYLKRPYIERVLRVRFNELNVVSTNDSQTNAFVNDLIDFIKNNSDITQSSLVDLTGNSLQSLHKSEIVVFSKFIRIIEALITELARSSLEIDKIRKKINWKPVSDNRGPEFTVDLTDIDFIDNDPNNKVIEQNIIYIDTQKTLQETDFDIGLDDPDLGNFSFSNIDDIVFGSLKNVSQFYDKQLNTLYRQRNEIGNTANVLIRNIEIISGEFSGLGLLDVVAVQATLWSIKPGALLGLIDDDAFSRMQDNDDLQVDVGSRLSPLDSMAEFEKKIAEIYILMGSFYQDIFNFGGKNK